MKTTNELKGQDYIGWSEYNGKAAIIFSPKTWEHLTRQAGADDPAILFGRIVSPLLSDMQPLGPRLKLRLESVTAPPSAPWKTEVPAAIVLHSPTLEEIAEHHHTSPRAIQALIIQMVFEATGEVVAVAND